MSRDSRISTELVFDRLRSAVGSEYSSDNVPRWIEKNTFIRGKPFSFKGHAYQLKILGSKKPIQVIKKCSQLGISELMVRRALALCYMIPNFSLIQTLPTASFAAMFCRTRIDPVIKESELLQDALDSNNNNNELKGIGTSLLYIRGTFNQNAAISVPSDCNQHDEIDFSDPEALTSFQSRLTHSPYRWKMEVSTPTVAKYGVSEKFEGSNRHFNWCKCKHCGHWSLPDYQRDVIVPGFSGDIMTLDKFQLPKTRWNEAYLACPKCRKELDLSSEYRSWVVENPDEVHQADGFQLSPFDAPSFIKVQFLMQARTEYSRVVDFINFNLGQTSEDAMSGLQESDYRLMENNFVGGTLGRVLGIDMGMTCHIVVGGIDGSERLQIEKLITCSYKEFDQVLAGLIASERPLAIVMDSQPYLETVFRNQQRYQNLYGAVYITSASLKAFTLVDEEEDKSGAMLDQRQINVNRNAAFDMLMEDIRANKIGANPLMQHWDQMQVHMSDMRRIRMEPKKNQPDAERFQWVKSKDGNDHFHHAALYCWIASKLRLAARPVIVLPPAALMFRRRLKGQL